MNTPSNPPRSSSGKILAGVLLLLVGSVLLLERLNFLYAPFWLFTWPVFLIVLGLFIGFRHNFRNPGWFILVTIGSVFLLEMINPDFNFKRYIWPILIILIGLWMIFGRNRHSRHRYSRYTGNNPNNTPAGMPPQTETPSPLYNSPSSSENYSPASPLLEPTALTSENYINITAVLGGVKRLIVAKNFQGGEITTFMGGADINLTQADIQGRVVLDINQVMGGTRLIVPSHWNVISEVVSVFGGIDDKRVLQPSSFNADKVLVIKGTSFMGGVDISSF
jgi:predicted membrane protein